MKFVNYFYYQYFFLSLEYSKLLSYRYYIVPLGNATLFHTGYCEEGVNAAGLLYSVLANLGGWGGMPGAIAMTPGQTLRIKLLESSHHWLRMLEAVGQKAPEGWHCLK